jgi:hypothetical protein
MACAFDVAADGRKGRLCGCRVGGLEAGTAINAKRIDQVELGPVTRHSLRVISGASCGMTRGGSMSARAAQVAQAALVFGLVYVAIGAGFRWLASVEARALSWAPKMAEVAVTH